MGILVGLCIPPLSRTLSEIQDLSALLSGLCLHEGTDGWRWLLNLVTSFLVKHISKLIDDDTLFSNRSGKTHEWNPLLPKKINIFVWRLALNRLPLLTTLADKGLDIPCILCHVCGDVPESLDHVFLRCRKANLIWSKCIRWWGIDTSINDKSVLDVIGGLLYF
ncbi:RNA-directed DNA polymerase, eukaryota, reverse transcriptase zinc-binding domain protein [Tanacetum coccineum]|uniref:RNA-directed DNA polymerase, eukaryota, reverse transcriptase zinc-binding domain protein n=1 Tax=Tanacetum coccineum TaxID=301880 RepID=A0ABQ4Y077_9ASTR